MSRINIQRALAVLAFATISALQLANASDYADITCRQSGMCSMGGTKHFHGEIASSKGFKEALDSVSFKREIIIVVTFGTMYLEFVFQLRAQLRRLGMDHFLVLSYNEHRCQQVNDGAREQKQETGCQQVKDVARGQKQVSCAWDDSPQLGDAWKGGTLLWHLRWRFLARAARIQYNVLSLDRPINPTLFKNCAKEDWTATGPDGKTYSRMRVGRDDGGLAEKKQKQKQKQKRRQKAEPEAEEKKREAKQKQKQKKQKQKKQKPEAGRESRSRSRSQEA
eukprot:gene28037-31136_t